MCVLSCLYPFPIKHAQLFRQKTKETYEKEIAGRGRRRTENVETDSWKQTELKMKMPCRRLGRERAQPMGRVLFCLRYFVVITVELDKRTREEN